MTFSRLRCHKHKRRPPRPFKLQFYGYRRVSKRYKQSASERMAPIFSRSRFDLALKQVALPKLFNTALKSLYKSRLTVCSD